MKTFLLIIALTACTVSISHAQEVKKSQPDSLIKPIPYGYGRQAGYLYTVDGKLQTPLDIQVRLMRYAPSAVEFKAAKRDAPWSFGLLAASAITSGLALHAFYENSKPPIATAAFINDQPGFTYTYPNNNKTGAYILTGVAVGFLAAAITNWVNTAIHGNRAIILYNQQYQ